MIGKKWVYLERNSLHRVWVISEGERALKYSVVSFFGRITPIISGEGLGFPGTAPPTTF